MAAGGECPALGSRQHRSRLGPAGLPSLSQARMYLPASPCSPLVRAGARPGPWGLEEESEQGLHLQEQGGCAARFSTFPCAGACRDGEFWTGGGVHRRGMQCPLRYCPK